MSDNKEKDDKTDTPPPDMSSQPSVKEQKETKPALDKSGWGPKHGYEGKLGGRHSR